jgi:hypothetical protein
LKLRRLLPVQMRSTIMRGLVWCGSSAHFRSAAHRLGCARLFKGRQGRTLFAAK